MAVPRAQGAGIDPARWDRIQALFHSAAELPEAARAAFVAARCPDDPGVAAEVMGMLRADAAGGSLLDRGVARMADELLHPPGGALPAMRFGPYRVVRLLGEGGMGVVYLAEREDLGTVAAVKILRDAWLSPSRRERFASEQRTLAGLNHPSIARLYDADTLADGTPWFVMEYVEGEILTAHAGRMGLTIAERLRLFRAVCASVQHAHEHAVIHRDLKPSNIMVTAEGAVKLLDFGIAKQLDEPDADARRTATGMRLMTPAYAAPEQLRGESAGAHTDVYSLGVVLYELLTGRLPFDRAISTPEQLGVAAAGEEPPRPSAAAADRSLSRAEWADLDVLSAAAMHRDAARRYRTVDALIRDLDHYLAGQPLEARPDSWRYRSGKFVRRNRGVLAATGLAAAALAVLAVSYTIRLAGARNAALAQAARTGRLQQFTLKLFEGGDDAAGPAESLRVVTLIDRGVREAEALTREPVVQAELFATLGGVYQKLGNLPRADSLLQLALDRRRALLGSSHADVASSLVALGMLRDGQARYDEAERLVREGLAMTRRTAGPDDPALARATAALGQVLEDRGDYEKAIPALEDAMRLQRAADPHGADYSASLSELANVHFYAGHLDVSDSLNREALAIDRVLYGPRHPSVANDLINLGAIEAEQSHYPAAERYYREALDINRRWYGADHPETASNLTMLARVVLPQGRLDEAAAMLRGALAVQERVYGKVHPRVASALNDLGHVAQRQGRLDEAEALYQRQVDIYRAVYNDKHYLIGIALSNLAGVSDARKDFARGERILREVLVRYAAVLAPDHQLVGIARIRLGRMLLKQRQYAAALDESKAGYDVLHAEPEPPKAWIDAGRADLAAEYAAQGMAAEAARFSATPP